MSAQTVNALLDQLHTSENGLTTDDARQRLAQTGPNDPSGAKRRGIVMQILAMFANPLVLILLIASLATGLLGDIVNASVIAAIVLFSVALDFTQTFRSQRAAERLRDQVAPTATVLRDGKWIESPRRELVPGDIIRLIAGDLVPADARLIQSRDLHINQAALTGESLPVEKEATDAAMKSDAPADALNAVFLGTSS